jgi:hypothetical protein
VSSVLLKIILLYIQVDEISEDWTAGDSIDAFILDIVVLNIQMSKLLQVS